MQSGPSTMLSCRKQLLSRRRETRVMTVGGHASSNTTVTVWS
jgi:hypothetical protein